jgi:hypothetical protein
MTDPYHPTSNELARQVSEMRPCPKCDEPVHPENTGFHVCEKPHKLLAVRLARRIFECGNDGPGLAAVRLQYKTGTLAAEKDGGGFIESALASFLWELLDELQPAAETSARIGPREPDNDMVICPNCTSQFRAIPVNVQTQLRRPFIGDVRRALFTGKRNWDNHVLDITAQMELRGWLASTPEETSVTHAVSCPHHPYQELLRVRDCTCGAVKSTLGLKVVVDPSMPSDEVRMRGADGQEVRVTGLASEKAGGGT